MMKSWHQTLLLGAGFGTAFLLGQWTNRSAVADGSDPAWMNAQGRGPVNPPPAQPKPTGGTEPVDTSQPTVVYSEESGSSAAANGFLAVTGSYGVGTSVLYLVDTRNHQLAVYEARGGSTEQRRIVLVGARRIDLDLQLESYNDRSEYQYDRLKEVFQKRDPTGAEVKTGLEPGSGRK